MNMLWAHISMHWEHISQDLFFKIQGLMPKIWWVHGPL